ncbi:MAG: hypothetical protein Q4A52_07085, partial [Bacillota bacterium]|nr:hypothetical protein [Bacillota bacterium]
MTETNLIHPFKVNCKQCGAPANFDIIKQSYCCPSCGSESGISEIRVREQQWRTLNRETIEESFREHPVEAHRCPSCGAQVVFGAGEISEQCDFCSTKLVSSELMDVSRMP